MERFIIGFIPPLNGMTGEFNTIRVGAALSKKLKTGDKVYLVDEKAKRVFGGAEVTKIETGELGELCVMHGAQNHTELGQTDGRSSERLFKLVQKLYGPHIATHNKKSTVVYLKRLE